MNKKLKLSFLGLATMTFCMTASFASSNYMTKEINTNANYWTKERLQNAKPLPMPLVDPNKINELPLSQLPKQDIKSGEGKRPEIKDLPKAEQLYTPRDTNSVANDKISLETRDRGSSNEEFSSSRLIPLTADQSYPYRAVGKLYFTIPGSGNYVCSASTINRRIVLTAGHCLHKGSGGADGYYTNFKFIPAFRDGTAPFQTWTASSVIVTTTWATGNGAVPNAADYGMLEMVDNNIDGVETPIGAVTGYLGYQTLSLMPNHTHLLGYPCNLDNCLKMHQVTAQSAKAVSPNNVEYGSDMRGGASGGPWVQNFGALADGQTGGNNPGLNRVVGVTSYGYVSSSPKALGASIFDSRFTTILNAICAHKAGNCA